MIRPETKDILVSGLLHPDVSVRTGAASLAFNVAARSHAPFRTSKAGAQSYNWAEVDRRERNDERGQDMELVVALLEATERETNEEVGSCALETRCVRKPAHTVPFQQFIV